MQQYVAADAIIMLQYASLRPRAAEIKCVACHYYETGVAIPF
jgi:hypothetical protein